MQGRGHVHGIAYQLVEINLALVLHYRKNRPLLAVQPGFPGSLVNRRRPKSRYQLKNSLATTDNSCIRSVGGL